MSDVSIVDVGLSDHHLLTWLVSTPRSQQQQQHNCRMSSTAIRGSLLTSSNYALNWPRHCCVKLTDIDNMAALASSLRPADCRELFRHAETVAQHQAVSPGVHLPVACRRTGTEPT